MLQMVLFCFKFSVVGSSIDSSPGECFDKCSRMLGLHNLPNMRDISGGRAVEMMAKSVDNKTDLDFPVPMRNYRDCRFSFSGTKATIYDHINRVRANTNIDCDENIPNLGEFHFTN